MRVKCVCGVCVCACVRCDDENMIGQLEMKHVGGVRPHPMSGSLW